MYTGLRIECIASLDQDPGLLGRNKEEQLTELVYFKNSEGAQNEIACGCTHLIPRFSSDFSGLLVLLIYATERKTEVSFLHFV